jgi:hypothetical protein
MRISLFTLTILLFLSCQKAPSSSPEEQNRQTEQTEAAEAEEQSRPASVSELEEIIANLRDDENHKVLKSLWPKREECRELLTSDEATELLYNYVQEKFKEIETLPEKTMKPVSENAGVNIISATKQELRKGKTNGLPAPYKRMAMFMKNDASLYGLQYINEQGEVEKARSAFFWVSNRWVFIPMPFQAFQ